MVTSSGMEPIDVMRTLVGLVNGCQVYSLGTADLHATADQITQILETPGGGTWLPEG